MGYLFKYKNFDIYESSFEKLRDDAKRLPQDTIVAVPVKEKEWILFWKNQIIGWIEQNEFHMFENRPKEVNIDEWVNAHTINKVAAGDLEKELAELLEEEEQKEISNEKEEEDFE